MPAGFFMPMNTPVKSNVPRMFGVAILVALAVCGTALSLPARRSAPLPSSIAAASPAVTDPWTATQTVEPPALVKELASGAAAKRPTVVCVAPRFLFEGGHIPGAVYHGPGSSPQALADLKKWAQDVPRSTNLVLYCGCCPLDRCPNLRPAFQALQAMGFTHLRALLLPTNFYTDWASKGFPTEKGSK